MEENTFKKGDIFHDGVLGYWIFESDDNSEELKLIGLEYFTGDEKSKCDMWHDTDSWNLEGIEIICNYYDNPEQSAGLIGDGTSLQEKFIKAFNLK